MSFLLKRKKQRNGALQTVGKGRDFFQSWPGPSVRCRPRWFPAGNRLIGLVRSNKGSFVLPPAMVRKAAWRD